ncbi:MAG: hypothetical protein NZ699_16150 [Roseiflexus sp.]|nr:hypothetical protein [Roseiflexus sp.]
MRTPPDRDGRPRIAGRSDPRPSIAAVAIRVSYRHGAIAHGCARIDDVLPHPRPSVAAVAIRVP